MRHVCVSGGFVKLVIEHGTLIWAVVRHEIKKIIISLDIHRSETPENADNDHWRLWVIFEPQQNIS